MDTDTLSVNKPTGHEREIMENQIKTIDNGALATEFETKLVKLLKQQEQINETVDELKAKLVETMQALGVTHIAGEKLDIVYVKGGPQQRFDPASFKLAHPKIYESSKKEYQSNPNVRSKAKL